MFLTRRRIPRPRTLRSLLLGAAALSMLAPARAQAPVAASVGAAHKAELVQRVHEYHVSDIWPSKLIGGIDFKLSEAAWQALLTSDGVTNAARVSRDLGDYIKGQKIGDLESVETANGTDRTSTQAEVDALLAQAKKKISLTVEATQPKLSANQTRLFFAYFTYLGQFLGRDSWTPRGGRANIKLVMSSTAKDIAVTVSKDATNFTIIAPFKEPLDWGSKIDKGMKRGAK